MNQNTHQSVYREKMLEHLLISELLKHSWLHAQCNLEVSQPAIDRAGHDVILEANGITRHIQLKSSALDGATATQKVHVELAKKPSGCVIWVRFDAEELTLGPFLFFGGTPGQPLPALDELPVARHSKANALGVKLERPNIRVVPQSRFQRIDDIPELYWALFG